MGSDQFPDKPETFDIPGGPAHQHESNDSGKYVGVHREFRHEMGFSGPIPPPQLLADYDRTCPGSADRLIHVAEQEAEHRRSIEQAVVRAEIERVERESEEAKRGQYCALIITLAGLAAGAYTALQGHEVAGSILGVGGIGGIVTAFILGRKPLKPEPTPAPNKTSSKSRKNRKSGE